MLADTPSPPADLTKGLTQAQLRTPPEPDEWSARDVLAHLCACSDMWGKYIIVILNEDHPTFKAMNPTNWIKHTNYLELEFRPSLQAFTAQRTVQTYAQWLANHEQSHFRQMERVANTLRR